VVLLDEDGQLRIPAGPVLPGEHPLANAAIRIALEQAGFRRQGTHVFAISVTRDDVALWMDGARYVGDLPHRTDARWWTGGAPAAAEILRARHASNTAELVRMADDARVALTDEQYWADSRRVLDDAYLAATTPEGGSGFGGDARDWFDERSVLCDAITRDGTFLDTACANGHLIDSLTQWCAARGVRIEPYGLDISARLVHVARDRLPLWRDRIWVGNALTWMPPNGQRFEYVHALLECVPDARHGDLVRHLLGDVVVAGGRLIVSHYNAGRDAERRAAAILGRLGYAVAGETGVPRRRGQPVRQPSAWIDAR
jgi:2-polyprenyl-3-methyl-5-hydroxy-6-metoxy-1,4-benzoquinol methylase